VAAEIDAAQGRAGQARSRLASLQGLLAGSGMVMAELQRRLLLLKINRAEGRPEAKQEARALEKDAGAHGAGLIVRRVQAL